MKTVAGGGGAKTATGGSGSAVGGDDLKTAAVGSRVEWNVVETFGMEETFGN